MRVNSQVSPVNLDSSRLDFNHGPDGGNILKEKEGKKIRLLNTDQAVFFLLVMFWSQRIYQLHDLRIKRKISMFKHSTDSPPLSAITEPNIFVAK